MASCHDSIFFIFPLTTNLDLSIIVDMDTENSLKETLVQNEHELASLVRKRTDIDNRINKLILSVRALTNLLDDDIERIQHARALEDFIERLQKPGLSQTITEILFRFPNGLNPIQIRNVLVSSGTMDLREYSNPSASIHTTLRRLVESGKVEMKRTSGKKMFRIPKQVKKQ